MPGILSLSNELIINVFLASPRIHNALRLSNTSRLFRAIFLEHEALIMEGILRPQIPSFDDAAVLAITETLLWDIKGPMSMSSDAPLLPLRFRIPRLLRNAKLASSTCAESAAHPLLAKYFGDGGDVLTPVPATYYFIRQVLLAYDFRHLRDPLYRRLRTAPVEWINRQNQLVSFLFYDANLAYQFRHRIHSTLGDITEYPGKRFTTDRWIFAVEVITSAQLDRRQPTGNLLELSIREYNRC
jgi:hypothetical protein